MDVSSPALVPEADNVTLLDLTTDILRVRTDSISSRVERPTSRGQFWSLWRKSVGSKLRALALPSAHITSVTSHVPWVERSMLVLGMVSSSSLGW